jgi:hypothetical protein
VTKSSVSSGNLEKVKVQPKEYSSSPISKLVKAKMPPIDPVEEIYKAE